MYENSILVFVDSPADSQVIQGYQFFKVFDEHQLEYILLAKGASDDVYMVGKLAAFQIQNLLVAYKERFDKDNFIKNLLLDNLLLVDIYNRAKKLHIDTDVKRVVYLSLIHISSIMISMERIYSLPSSVSWIWLELRSKMGKPIWASAFFTAALKDGWLINRFLAALEKLISL